MRAMIRTLGTLALLTASTAGAAEPAKLCNNALDQDRQPEFSTTSLEMTNPTMKITDNKELQLNTALKVFDPEDIRLPFDQNISVSYVFESAGASHTLGYMYMDELLDRQYVDASGNLLDKNGNGILDLHEDIYNLSPSSGTTSRPYVGGSRRCSAAAAQLTLADGTKFSMPDLASSANCTVNSPANGTGSWYSNIQLPDMRPPGDDSKIWTALVGTIPGADVTESSDAYSDKGLYKHVPNLLEPKHPSNNDQGMGRIVFLSGDDDSDESNWRNLAPVKDKDNLGEGVPDYDVSAYTAEGIKRSVNPDEGISPSDRTVDLGPVQGNREIIFFLIVYYDSPHSTTNGTVYPCMKMDAAGKCLLHLRTPISVFFSKSAWNMDQNMRGGSVVAARNIGCGYVEGAGCVPEDPANSPGSCTVKDSTEKLCGWLDGPTPQDPEGNTLYRLEHDPLYGNLKMPMEKVVVPRPPGNRNAMPHVIVGAPSTDPFRWILGFEDLNGGGDRDFNDIVFVINKENGGNTRSASVSGDITPDIAEDFTITKVRFTRQDDIAPAPRTCTNGPPCWSEEQEGENACSPPGGPEATIRYSIAVDCNICANGTCTRNQFPTWVPVDFPETSPPTQTVELDLLSLGVTGSQLCWKVDVSSPNERCHPIIDNINVGFQAVRSGSFARASPSAIGNALVWGVNETPGSNWGQNWPGTGLPAAATRAYDARKDYTLRGRLYFKSLYDPETPLVTTSTQHWEAGRVMADAFRGSTDPLTRKLYTVTSSTNFARKDVSTFKDGANSPLFPDELCDVPKLGNVIPWNLNGDNKCGTPTADNDSGHKVSADKSDRAFLVNWLYGWEDSQDPAPNNVKKPWALGGINLSTVALAIPPYKDTWYQNAPASEQEKFKTHFIDALKNRETVAYVGTMTGMLHAFKSGAYRTSTQDTCVGESQYRGYFEPVSGACANPAVRNYGTGDELFAYLPYGLLGRYRNQYAVFQGSGTLARPSMDASPSIANVDFGNLSPAKPAWTPSSADTKKGAKTVLVSASGKTSPLVFAMDITSPDKVGTAQYPIPMWEFDMLNTQVTATANNRTVTDAFTTARNSNASVNLPDTKGSRFAPTVVRAMWGSNAANAQWIAAVGTDYEPGPDYAGTLYLIDMKTGLPLASGSEKFAGVITLDKGAGIGAESAMVDLDKDGTFDVIYVPTTAGHVYRINLTKLTPGQPLGNAVQKCLVADAPTSLDKTAYNPAGADHQDQKFQQIFSNLAVTSTNTPSGPVVRFFFGTSDNPDLYSDGPPDKDNSYHYFLLGFEDTDPWGASGCKPTLEPMWADRLDAGQTVWGGVTLTADKVFATTAVGKAADVCNLSETKNGKFYSTSQLNQTGVPHAATGQDLGGHGISAPIIHDEHIIAIDALGNAVGMGADGARWNNKTGGSGNGSSRALLWEKMPDGKLPKP
ncbi:DUF4114 domain-containing protein [Corallococcus exiguus]|uniref:DUF4114 domain-containing protein n=1 Tax=Corallococcus TaxID=83461 RepID=UPI000EC54A8B|nr:MULTISPECIES: DUF4114 domain-containing protein [Corallococcus]NPC68607.1 DUF4114 domain-containing protein [Corallococcus exiguus]RKI04213.1 DUF4114 domain-containing protein [Corallococcus sp. AB038B]